MEYFIILNFYRFLSRNLILLEKKEEIDEEIIKFEEKN